MKSAKNIKSNKSSKTVKTTAKSKKPVLTKEQRSLIAQYAAMKAHLHTTFQHDRTKDDRKEQAQAFRDYAKSAPSFIRSRYADDIADILASLKKSAILPS